MFLAERGKNDMEKTKKLTSTQTDLMKRYLLWCYKTTKEELDKIDRYFTQLVADDYILDTLVDSKEYKSKADKEYKQKVDEFELYMSAKEEKVLKKKYRDVKKGVLDPHYFYLKKRLDAIEKTISHFLGKNELTLIKDLYEEEMTMRILEAREHL